jgi:hypothetical protein
MPGGGWPFFRGKTDDRLPAMERIVALDGAGEAKAIPFSVMREERVLETTLDGGHFMDQETGSTWSLSGDAIRGPLLGRRLDPIPHGNHFWFAWAVFKPETKVIRGG